MLRRHDRSHLRTRNRATGVPVREVRERPGELVHLEVPQRARIPDGGHRRLGREGGRQAAARGRRRRRPLAVDDASHLASVAVLPDQRGTTTARVLLDAAGCYADHGSRSARVRIDRALASTHAAACREAMASLGARHRTARPSRPQTNGTAGRCRRTLLEAWAEARRYHSNAERLAALPGWLACSQHRSPHTAPGGRPPIAAVNNVHGNYS